MLPMLLYGFVYTHWKRVGPIAVIVGAFTGAFPPKDYWVAATGHFGLEPGILSPFNFLWYSPPLLWAIACYPRRLYLQVCGYFL
jgi:protoheme IX farnesyltransferase